MSESTDRIQEALAAYLDYLELGGTKPDTSHLTTSEREELDNLINALEMTEGVAFGLGREPPAAPPEGGPERGETSERLLGELRDALPADVRVNVEPTRIVSGVGGVPILDALIVGTFGGRVRVLLLDAETAEELENNSDCLVDLGRLFGALPDTTAFALVAEDLSCLVVQPEDCAPKIHTPSGSLVSRRYRQPIRPAGEAIGAFINELIPYWDPVPAFDPGTQLTLDVSAVCAEYANAAVERQRGIGERARKGNPKKDVLLALGAKEVSALTKLTKGLYDGSVSSEELEERIERLAKGR